MKIVQVRVYARLFVSEGCLCFCHKQHGVDSTVEWVDTMLPLITSDHKTWESEIECKNELIQFSQIQS